jgi:predicted 3-demethylubiquinone-9 3-methyltransferase (glyoxalase superfamily)
MRRRIHIFHQRGIMGEVRRRISYCLWFDGQAEAAAEFYGSVFSNTGIGATERFDGASAAASGQPEGSVMTAEFTIEGDEFLALNGGPHFRLNPSISFFVNCRTTGEVEDLWEKLSDGGTALMPLDSYPFSERYGWIQDRFGVSWQVMLSQGGVRHRIVPSLLFVGEKYGRAEEAAGFYTSVFRNSTMGNVHRYGPDQQPDREGAVAYADFEIEGQLFAVMDSGAEHNFDFNEALSFVINCEDQQEVDYYWDRLSAVPESEQCGWLKDRFGVSWQVVPVALPRLLADPDRTKAGRVMEAMLKMKKLDVAGLERAGQGL